MTPSAMSALMTTFGDVATGVLSIVTSVVTTVIAQPLLLIPIGVGILGTGVGLIKSFAKH